MNKYGIVFSTSLKQEKVTWIDTIFRVISFSIIIAVFIQLWSYIYGEDGTSKIINNYTYGQMLWYLLITELIIFTVHDSSMVRDISNDIKSGKIAYMLNKPYNYFMYITTSHYAQTIWKLLFFIPAVLLIGIFIVGYTPVLTIPQILICLIVIGLSALLMWLIAAIIGMFCFWIEDAIPIYWIWQKFLFICGMFFPLEFMPTWIQPIIAYSPIYSMLSGPAKLVANFSWELLGQVVLSQTIWIIIFILIGNWIYQCGRKKVNINGG